MSSATNASNDGSQITHVLNRDKKYLTEHGQKLFNAINVLLDDEEQLELTQALFKYQKEHNVFTLVRSCCELFDTPKKKSLMLFMRPVIPIRDRFHYDEYYKLFFPEEFQSGVTSIFADLIPKELLEKTMEKVNKKKKLNMEKEKQKESDQCLETIKVLEKVNFDLNLDLQKLINKASEEKIDAELGKLALEVKMAKEKVTGGREENATKIGGFRIIELAPNENESLGFDICMGPTGTFIMISYVEPNSQVGRLGMKIGDELVSVNEISFKMIELEQAIDILSTEATLRIVLQTSGFMPENVVEQQDANHSSDAHFRNEWMDPFGSFRNPPSESKTSLKRLIRRITINPKSPKGFGISIRGGIEYSLGIFISRVEPESDAHKAGLKVSDQIIEVNGQTFSRISHENAVQIFKTNLINFFTNKSPIKMTVRYLGKLPVLSKSNGESDVSRDSQIHLNSELEAAVKQAVIISEAEIIQNKANSNNSESDLDSFKKSFESSAHELNLFRYYLSDYLSARINLQYFLFLISNRLLKSANKLLNNESFVDLVKSEDKKIFEKFLKRHNKPSEIEANKDEIELRNEQISLEYFKSSIVTRSLESLKVNSGEVNFDQSTDGIKNKSFYKSLENLVVLN